MRSRPTHHNALRAGHDDGEQRLVNVQADRERLYIGAWPPPSSAPLSTAEKARVCV